MRTSPKIVLLPVALLAALAVACSKGDTGSMGPHPVGVAGSWSAFTEVLIDAGNAITCHDTATVTISQSGATFTGLATQTGQCVTSGVPSDDSGTLGIGVGVVSGDSITFQEPGNPSCLYAGTTTGDPATSASGTLACDGNGFHFVGTWQMHR